MFRMSQLISLILAFTLGFSCAGGIIVGGVAIALGSFRVRDIEKYEIMDIPDEMFMEENPKTDLLNLTAFEMIDEMKRLYKMGDALTISYIQEEYGIKIPSAADKFLTDDARNMPIKALFSEDGVKSLLSTMYIGYVQSFECHALDSTEPADPALGKEEARWFNPTTGEYVNGINETLAFICLGDFVSGKVDVTTIIGGLHIGEALGYYSEFDSATGKDIWYDGVTGEPLRGIMSVFAGCTVDNIDETIDTVTIGELLGYYQLEENGPWYEDDKNGNPVLATGLMASLANSTLDTIDDDIEEIKVGDLVGYYQLEENGPWYEDDKNGNPVLATGLMASLANSSMNTLSDDIQGIKLGNLFGYYQLEENGPWYEDDKNGNRVLASGLTASLADSTMNTIDEDIPKIEIGTLLGYEQKDGEWVKLNEETGKLEKATGVMSILVDCDMDGAGDAINEAKIGTLMNYENVDGVWYDENGEEVSGFMSKIASSSLVKDPDDENSMAIGDVFSELEVGDIVETRTGIFAIIPAETKIENIGDAVNDSIMDSPLQFFMNEGLVSLDQKDGSSTQSTADVLDEISALKNDYKLISESDSDFEEYYKGHGDWIKVGNQYKIPTWRTKPMSDSFGYIVNLLSSGVGIDE